MGGGASQVKPVMRPGTSAGGKRPSGANVEASDSHLDLVRAPNGLYGVRYIDLVSLAPFLGGHEAAVHHKGQ